MPGMNLRVNPRPVSLYQWEYSLGLDRMLRHDGLEVMIKLLLRRTDVSFTTCFIAWSAGSTKDLPVSRVLACRQ